MPTPNRGYTYPTMSSPSTVPADLQQPLEQIDADVQALTDEFGAMSDKVAELPTAPELDQQIEETITSRSIQEVEGAVAVPADGPRIREFYSVGAGVTMGGEFFPPDTAFVVRRRTTGGSDVAVVGEGGTWRPFGMPPEVINDKTPPTAGTLNVTTLPDSADLTVAGAMDDVRLHFDGPYRFSRDAGATWTGWMVEPEYTFTQLTPDTEYTFQHEVRDQAGNTRLGGMVTSSTPKAPIWTTLLTENFNKPDGVLGGTTTTTGGFTWVGSAVAIEDGEVTTATPRGVSYAPFDSAVTSRVRARFDYSIFGDGAGDQIFVGFGLTSDSGVGRTFGVRKATLTDQGHPATGTLIVEWNPFTLTLTTTLNGVVIDTSEHPSTQFVNAHTVALQTQGVGSVNTSIDNLVVEVDTA